MLKLRSFLLWSGVFLFACGDDPLPKVKLPPAESASSIPPTKKTQPSSLPALTVPTTGPTTQEADDAIKNAQSGCEASQKEACITLGQSFFVTGKFQEAAAAYQKACDLKDSLGCAH